MLFNASFVSLFILVSGMTAAVLSQTAVVIGFKPLNICIDAWKILPCFLHVLHCEDKSLAAIVLLILVSLTTLVRIKCKINFYAYLDIVR